MVARTWIGRWSAEYPNREAEDEMLRPFRGADYFSRTQVEALVDWKFQTDPRRRQRTRNLLGVEDDERIEELTRQAFACFHDYVALLACEALHGVGTATASVLLMAQNPDRYTVIDSRALASLRAMGRLPSGGEYAGSEDWEPYLDACRGVANETGHSLRDVDRALYAANGRIE